MLNCIYFFNPVKQYSIRVENRTVVRIILITLYYLRVVKHLRLVGTVNKTDHILEGCWTVMPLELNGNRMDLLDYQSSNRQIITMQTLMKLWALAYSQR